MEHGQLSLCDQNSIQSTGHTTKDSFHFQGVCKQIFFFLSKVTRLVLPPTQPPIQ